jgi:hypothetical protein
MLRGLMQPEIFKGFNEVMFMVQSGEKSLTDFANSAYDDINGIQRAYKSLLQRMKQKGDEFLQEMERNMRQQWGWFAYMPPEARGAMIAAIGDVVAQPQYAQNSDLRQSAAFAVNELLATGQTTAHLVNTLDRITVAIGEQADRADGVRTVNALLENSSFAGGLARALDQVASAQPLIQRPFMRNDEASFVVAQMGFSHVSTVA